MIMIKKRISNMFYIDNYVLTMTFLPGKLVFQVFWLPGCTSYSHQELICYYWKNTLNDYKGKFE